MEGTRVVRLQASAPPEVKMVASRTLSFQLPTCARTRRIFRFDERASVTSATC
jgi:hypothetical protein